MRKFAVLSARYYVDPRDEWITVNGRQVPQYRVKWVKVMPTIEADDAELALSIAKLYGYTNPVIQSI